MPHFLIDKNCIKNGKIVLFDKETIAHLTLSLRETTGSAVKFIADETVYLCEIETISKSELSAKILTSEKSKRKLDFELCALVCVLKPEGMHLAIQNAVQLGAKEVYTTYSDNSTVNKNSVLKKAEKWEKIAMESFKQCERADLPKVYDIETFEEIFSKFKKENILIFAEKYDELTIQGAFETVDKNERILCVFGPEGGFSEREFNFFKNEKLKLVTLGNLILKAPNAVTAGLFGVIQCKTS